MKKLAQSCYFLKPCPLCHGPMSQAPVSSCMAHKGPSNLRAALKTFYFLYSSYLGAAAQAFCSFKVVLFMLVWAFLVPEHDLSFPVSFPFSFTFPLETLSEILLQHENVRTPPIKLYHACTENLQRMEGWERWVWSRGEYVIKLRICMCFQSGFCWLLYARLPSLLFLRPVLKMEDTFFPIENLKIPKQ